METEEDLQTRPKGTSDGKFWCYRCSQHKPLDRFFVCVEEKYYRPRRCVDCTPDPAAIREERRIKQYGLVPGQFSSMLASQGGVCAICQGVPKSTHHGDGWHLDHCHKTKQVRGVLCVGCNTALGKFGDNQNILVRAAVYLHTARNRSKAVPVTES